eukprot:1075205-Pleurochrysis_carterae.AAC.3
MRISAASVATGSVHCQSRATRTVATPDRSGGHGAHSTQYFPSTVIIMVRHCIRSLCLSDIEKFAEMTKRDSSGLLARIAEQETSGGDAYAPPLSRIVPPALKQRRGSTSRREQVARARPAPLRGGGGGTSGLNNGASRLSNIA